MILSNSRMWKFSFYIFKQLYGVIGSGFMMRSHIDRLFERAVGFAQIWSRWSWMERSYGTAESAIFNIRINMGSGETCEPLTKVESASRAFAALVCKDLK